MQFSHFIMFTHCTRTQHVPHTPSPKLDLPCLKRKANKGQKKEIEDIHGGATTELLSSRPVPLPMLPLVSPLVPLGRYPMRLVGFAVTTNTTIAEIRTALISLKVLSQQLSTVVIDIRTMASTQFSLGRIGDSNFHMIDLTLLAPIGKNFQTIGQH